MLIRPSTCFCSALSNVNTKEDRDRNRKHQKEEYKSESDVAGHVRDDAHDKGTEERCRLVCQREQREER